MDVRCECEMMIEKKDEHERSKVEVYIVVSGLVTWLIFSRWMPCRLHPWGHDGLALQGYVLFHGLRLLHA